MQVTKIPLIVAHKMAIWFFSLLTERMEIGRYSHWFSSSVVPGPASGIPWPFSHSSRNGCFSFKHCLHIQDRKKGGEKSWHWP